MTKKQLQLIDAARALPAYGVNPSYQQIWGAVASGRVPAERVGKKWVINEVDLGTVAKAFAHLPPVKTNAA